MANIIIYTDIVRRRRYDKIQKQSTYKRGTYRGALSPRQQRARCFYFFRGQVAELSDKLAKSQAYSAKVESELDKLRESYDSLKDEYAKLEQTKAEEKNAKVVYLTFDDYPSENTVKILDILEQYNVKATFFHYRQGGRGRRGDIPQNNKRRTCGGQSYIFA